MKFTPRILWLSTFLSPLVMVSTVGQNMALAQIIPDNTLREESSIVTPGSADGRLTEVLINGGAERGSALFHSFDDFNVNSGQEVSFVPGSSINQIFSRVTGGRISNINGLLGVDGLADLFFLNPNGVIFGPNAELDVGGSFVVTTGDRILFNKDISFSAVNPQAPSSLLTITSPFGIQFGANPGAIHVRQSDLAVPQGENLALIGGDIRINNGANLTARDGHLNLSAVSEAGIVDFKREASNPRNLVQIPDGIERANIALRNNSQGQVQGNGTGTIMLQANNVTLSGSQLQAGINQDSGAIDTRGGAIRIEATGDVRLVQRAEIRNEVRETALGNGGRIVIWGDRLLMRDGSEIRTGTSSSGSAGSIRIKVDQLILEEGNVPETPSEPRPDDEDDRPPRPDDEDDRPPRPDDEDDRPPRPDDEDDRPPRPDDEDDRPPRPDEDGDRPPRPDEDGDRPPRPDE
ncbi:MAG: filamentous hemagglutinin N-terminal domain-containing protein, partial [Cyanobacteria bacterium P01_F01_bin.150]